MHISEFMNLKSKSSGSSYADKLRAKGMYFELANYFRSQGEYTAAVIEIKKLIKLKPCFAYKLTLADIYIENRAFEQALIHVDDLLAHKSYSEEILYVVYLLKIECLIQLSHISDALQVIDELKFGSYDDELLAWQAVAMMKLNDYETALKFYQKSINKNQSNEKAWLGIGSIHCIKGDLELGVACYYRVLDINSESFAAINLINKLGVGNGK